MTISGDSYMINSKKVFRGIGIDDSDIEKVADFAYKMCFGEGHHRNHRTGGTLERGAAEKFCNTFQGKLAEICLLRAFSAAGLECAEPNFDIYGEGIWDDTDLVVAGKTVSVKSAAYFSNLLLLECADYDDSGNNMQNLVAGGTHTYDNYVLVRISPDIKSIFKRERMMWLDNISREDVMRVINSEDWKYDVGGCINHRMLVDMIRCKYIIPKDALLNGSTRMDAANYYVQAGDMAGLEKLIEALRR